MSGKIKLSDLPSLQFLETVLQDIPFLREMDLSWVIDAGRITANLDDGVFRVMANTSTPNDLDCLPFINRLYEEYGWKRDGFVGGRSPGWTDLKAWFEKDGYEIIVTGSRLASLGRPDGVTNYAIPFFAPPLPSIEALSTPEGQAQADEWHRRLVLRDW